MAAEPIAKRKGIKFTKEEIDEIKDAIEDSLKYYQDLLDDALSNPETKNMSAEYARARIKIIESIKRKLEN
jgi:predicted HicB family RNase H-like nuclease